MKQVEIEFEKLASEPIVVRLEKYPSKILYLIQGKEYLRQTWYTILLSH